MILKLIFIIIILLFLNNYNIEKLENINYHSKLIDNLQIYVIHYTPLKERKIIIEKQLKLNSLNYNFIEEFNKENLSVEDLKIFDSNKVKLSMCSNIIKHIQAYKKIMNSNYKFNLIFEDDVILNEYFNETLYKGLKQLPNNYDMLFIGSVANLHILKSIIIPNKLIYKKSIEQTS
jgi:GR25 family glycosyltransferase involved in LPS biosynthesis